MWVTRWTGNHEETELNSNRLRDVPKIGKCFRCLSQSRNSKRFPFTIGSLYLLRKEIITFWLFALLFLGYPRKINLLNLGVERLWTLGWGFWYCNLCFMYPNQNYTKWRSCCWIHTGTVLFDNIMICKARYAGWKSPHVLGWKLSNVVLVELVISNSRLYLYGILRTILSPGQSKLGCTDHLFIIRHRKSI